MDERSPRQPDPSDPPEDSDRAPETPAFETRPENPYRIPPRPSRNSPTDDPAAPESAAGTPAEQEAAASEADSGGEYPSPSHWDNPFRRKAQEEEPDVDRFESADPSVTGGFPQSPPEPSHQGEPGSFPGFAQPAGDTSWRDEHSFAWAADRTAEPVDEAWEAFPGTTDQHRGQPRQDEPYPASAQQSQGWTESSEGWGEPYYYSSSSSSFPEEPETWTGFGPQEPHTESWGTPPVPAADEQEPHTASWDSPYGSGQQLGENWDTPYGTSQPESRDSSPYNYPAENWDTPYGSSQSRGWDAPSGPRSPHGSWEGGTLDTPWGAPPPPSEPQGYHSESWGEPYYYSSSSSSFPEEPETWTGSGPQEPHTESWDSPYGSSQPESRDSSPYNYPAENWDTPYGSSQSRGWDTPYGGQPAYQGDTPYPGYSPGEEGFEGHAASGPSPGRPGDGFEYLYSGGSYGPGGPDDPGGPPQYGDGYDPGPPPRKSRRGLIIGVVSAVVVLALIGGGAFWYIRTLPQPEEATGEYAAAWEEQNYERLAAVTRGGDAEEVLSGIDNGLGVDTISVDMGEPTADGGTGSASYEVTVSLTNADDWGWEGELPLIREDGEWWVDFSPEVAYPELEEGQVLARTAVWGERGQILAADGTRLDTPEMSGSMQMIVGSMGEADEEDVEELGAAYSVGDTIGVDGLQRTYEERLAGEAATTILVVDAEEAEDPASLEATEDNTVTSLDGADGEDITTSLDMSVQDAAASAVIDSDDPVGLVALRASTGEILAAANVPGGFNRAFEGQFPPGSSFKIITYSALLDNGMSMDASLECPEEYELGGWPFRNANNAEYGSQSVTEAFATSCNTALVHEAGERLSPETLLASAEQFGMNAPLDIGVPTHEPAFPAVDSTTMLGSQSIGQGQILTSPLHMASVPAAISDGSWRHPVLVTEPTRDDVPEPTPIGNAETIQPMMRAVITDGTAEDIGFEGEVFGKTGTAEFGTEEDANDDDELPSHAWMVGYKDDIAFAVVVDGGGGGSDVAGPLAAAFTNAL